MIIIGDERATDPTLPYTAYNVYAVIIVTLGHLTGLLSFAGWDCPLV